MGFSTHLLCGFPWCGSGAGWHLSGNLGHQARYSPNATAVPCEIVYLYTLYMFVYIYIYMYVHMYM